MSTTACGSLTDRARAEKKRESAGIGIIHPCSVLVTDGPKEALIVHASHDVEHNAHVFDIRRIRT